MEVRKGYVAVGIVHKIYDQHRYDAYHLFGEKVHETAGPYENIKTNGLQFFSNIGAARKAARSITHNPGMVSSRLAEIQLGIYDRNEVSDMLVFDNDPKKRSLIVIVYLQNDLVTLVGRIVEGKPTCCAQPGAYLADNGCMPFLNLRDTSDAYMQHSRQNQSPATIAEFDFKMLKEKYS